MLSKRQQTWAKKAQDRLSTVGAEIISEWQGETGPLTIRCSCGNTFDTTWKRTVSCLNRSGLAGCPSCAAEAKGQFHRGDDQAVEGLAEHGFTLLSEYCNIHTPITVQCPRGHVHSRAYRDWKKADIKCRDCFREDVHTHFTQEGWQVLSPFEGMKASMTVQCPAGHISEVRYQTWNRPRKPGYNGCNQCKPKKHGQDRALSLNEVSEFLQSKGLRLTGEYINTATPVAVVCTRGHQTSVTLSSLRSRVQNGCGECYKEDRIPSDEEMLSNEIAQKISTRIYQELSKNGIQKKTWKSRVWARDVAKQIQEQLGARPEGYHLDHVVPCSFFDFRDEEQTRLCWSIENLRWMEASANISRGNRITIEEVRTFTPEQLALLLRARFAPKELLLGLGWHV